MTHEVRDVGSTMLSLEEFHDKYTVTIVRFELYPAQEPTSWCVGYTVKNNDNQYSMYIDTNVAIDSSKTNEDVLHAAWENVKTAVTNWACSVHCKSSLLNTRFTPTCLCDRE